MMRSIITTAARVIITLLLIALLGIALLLLYVSRLELEEYRHAIEHQLSSALQRPVSIGSGSIKFRHGLTVDLYQVEIGTEQDFYLRIPQISATIPLKPLLKKQIILKNVEILGAKTTLHLPLQQQPRRAATATTDTPFQLDIRMLTIRHAEARIYEKGVPLVHLTNLHAVIYDWQAQQSSQLVVSGQEAQTQTDFLLETMLPPLTGAHWRQLEWRADLQIGRHGPTTQVTDVPSALAQSGRIKLTLDGVPAAGALVSVSATRAGSITPLVYIDGIWTSDDDAEHFEHLDGKLLGFPASGHLQLQHSPVRQLSAQLESCNLTVTADDFAAIEQMTQVGFVSGVLDQLRLRIDHQWPETDATAALPLQIDGEIKLSDIVWDDPQPWLINAFASELTLSSSTLTLANTIIHTDIGSLLLSGQIDDPFSEPAFKLEASAAPLLEHLLAELSLPAGFAASGPTQLALDLSGTIAAPAFTLRANLDDSRVALHSYYRKDAQQPAHIEVSGTWQQRDRIELDSFDISLDPVAIAGKATIQSWSNEPRVALTTGHLDLSSLSSINRTFERLQLVGNASAELFFADNDWHGTLFLTAGGAHLTSLIGDLNSVSGQAKIDKTGLRFSQLAAKLGDSQFIVNGDMQGWSDPLLKLEVAAPTVRAQDLVFSNPELTLHNLRGRLEIDRNGITFDPVTVTLEESTQASVFGSVQNFSRAQTNLVIHGEKANVLDIINLFRDPTRASQKTTHNDSPREPITIHITAREGTLSGMKFTNARTTLIDHKGVLAIYPLTFESGGGWARAKVEYNRHDQSAPLKISGHINGVDAATIHQDLFDRPGLLRGPMTGDFYLEGDPGSATYWKYASGGAYFQIHQGTLRKFRGLAQIFSLLNVSQIFTGSLPDMDQEGMPFNLMEGSFLLRDGLVHTSDLKIVSEAMNMSIVGKQNLTNETLDMILGVMPLRTVDKVVSSIPIAGWVLAGEDRAVLTAYFHVEGATENPSVSAVPVNSISNTVMGVFKRTFGLPEKLIRDLGSFFQSETVKKEETE